MFHLDKDQNYSHQQVHIPKFSSNKDVNNLFLSKLYLIFNLIIEKILKFRNRFEFSIHLLIEYLNITDKFISQFNLVFFSDQFKQMIILNNLLSTSVKSLSL